MINKGVVVSNGCHRFFLYQTALAYEQAGLLRRLIAGWYVKSPLIARFLQSPAFAKTFGARLAKRLLARRPPGIDPSRLVSLLVPDLLERLGRSRPPDISQMDFFSYWSMRSFGLLSQRYVKDISLFHVRSGYGGRALAAAKKNGALCLVDHSIADPRFIAQTLEEEAARWGLSFQFPRLHWKCVAEDIEDADHILANSTFVRDTLVAKRGIPPHKISVLPLGVDLKRFAPAEPSGQAGRFCILFVGEIGLRKGALYLLQAFKELQLAEAELVMIGQVTEIAPLLARMGVEFRHIPAVPLQDLVAYYRRSSVFVFPSLIEGSARVVQEAMACGLPVITTPNAGSLVQDGVEGFLVPIRQVEALCQRILELYQNPERRVHMGREARATAERCFAPHHYREGLISLYHSLVGADSLKYPKEAN